MLQAVVGNRDPAGWPSANDMHFKNMESRAAAQDFRYDNRLDALVCHRVDLVHTEPDSRAPPHKKAVISLAPKTICNGVDRPDNGDCPPTPRARCAGRGTSR